MDPYYKQTIEYDLRGQKFTFVTANTLFSTVEIDMGTNILIRNITLNSPRTILDLGCGYGPIGIILKSKSPESQVIMLDKDLLALKYTDLNAQKNNVEVTTSPSIGLEAIGDKKFDLIVSNIPAKIGDLAIEKEFVEAPFAHLNPQGEYWFVIMSSLNRIIPIIAKKHHLPLTEIRRRKGHIVYKMINKTLPV